MAGAAVQSPAATRGRPACRHCGTPLRPGAQTADGFCCAGCAYVFRLIQEQGLGSYYEIKDPITVPADAAVFQSRDLTWLETAQREAEAAADGRPPSLTLDVQGISCAGCIWLIERVFQQQPGARDIEASAQLGQMRLRWIPAAFSAADFARKLQAFGYVAGPAGERPEVPETRGLVRRIGLCAAFAMNAMLFTLPRFFGMERTFAYANLFETLALVFGTLSVLVGGTYFLGRAVQSIRAGLLHIDLPIALGIAGAYLGSLYGWFTDQTDYIYFDFVCTFILLMLVGRWAQVAAVERNQRRLLGQQPKPPQVRLATGGTIPPERLVAGQVFHSAAGHAVPVEARLESDEAAFSLASINGESTPRSFRAGQRVPAGAVNLGRNEVRLTALQGWNESLLAQLLAPAERAGPRSVFLERIVRGYLVGILAIAALAGLGWWLGTHDALRTGSVVTAILVVSCPCAIGLAFPLADEMATVALRRRGVFVRSGEVWTRLHGVRRLVFDKTGTLTLENPILREPAALHQLAPGARQALLALVRDNPHPVSQCLLENLLAAGPDEPLAGEVTEAIGQGVTLVASGRTWRLGRPGWAAPACDAEVAGPDDPDRTGTQFTCDGTLLATFHFTDAARPDAREELRALAGLGFATYILSGDHQAKVNQLANELGLLADRAFGERTPRQKAEWLAANGADETLMLGDGANDSLAFDQARCRGTPVIHRGHLGQKADFYYLGRGIGGLRALFVVNAIRRRAQRTILVFSVIYNVLAVGLAVAGHMNPLVAAILMPLNSLITLALVTGGLRPAFR
ncbi:MAG: heavy metal translocating P-type ATPase metal-binding domain-containing protein [Verrucomicrobia bacterium]|nr:heavy metal translocating P-type ATPase metal-binding domain-containing protein [Verrucomicrobiota bacterium]